MQSGCRAFVVGLGVKVGGWVWFVKGVWGIRIGGQNDVHWKFQLVEG